MKKNVQNKLNSIEEAISDIKSGKLIIVVDDENRENEGDFICAAELASPSCWSQSLAAVSKSLSRSQRFLPR